jgi:hypothetical protein
VVVKLVLHTRKNSSAIFSNLDTRLQTFRRPFPRSKKLKSVASRGSKLLACPWGSHVADRLWMLGNQCFNKKLETCSVKLSFMLDVETMLVQYLYRCLVYIRKLICFLKLKDIFFLRFQTIYRTIQYRYVNLYT